MIKILFVVLGLGYATHMLASEESTLDFERKGFHFGLGGAIAIIELDPHILPLLSIDVGYNFTENFAFNMTTKTILFVSFVGLEAKLYTKESNDTWFVTTAINREYSIGEGPIENLYGAGVGYARKNKEIELSITGRKGKAAGFLTYKYIW